MTPEGQKPSEQIDFKPLLILGGIFLLSQFAFSKKSAREIGKRAGWRSELSGKSFWDGFMLHMCHKNHDKSNPLYDDASQGICLTVEEHLKMHKDAKGHAKDIGLNECQNNYAIRKLKETPIYNKHKK